MNRADRSSVPAADLQRDDKHPPSPPTGPDITTRRLAAPGEGLLEAQWLERTDVPTVVFEHLLELAIEIGENRPSRRLTSVHNTGPRRHPSARAERRAFDRADAPAGAPTDRLRTSVIKSGKVFQSTADPNDVTVIHEFDSATDAQALLDSPELKAAMGAAGVQGAPQIWITEQDD